MALKFLYARSTDHFRRFYRKYFLFQPLWLILGKERCFFRGKWLCFKFSNFTIQNCTQLICIYEENTITKGKNSCSYRQSSWVTRFPKLQSSFTKHWKLFEYGFEVLFTNRSYSLNLTSMLKYWNSAFRSVKGKGRQKHIWKNYIHLY